MHKLCFYVPVEQVDEVKQAIFAAGAGKIGNYDRCCWQILGEGQFRPLDKSTPFIGKQNEISKVAEYKVEVVCEDACLAAVIEALKQVHPYETPAYQVWALVDL